jgi:hypothetical protein
MISALELVYKKYKPIHNFRPKNAEKNIHQIKYILSDIEGNNNLCKPARLCLAWQAGL